MKDEPNNKPILFEYFDSTVKVLLARYKLSKQQKASDNIGQNRESFIDEFLSKVLAPKLSIKSGEIWDSSKNKTGQEDIIILRDDAPALHFGSNDVYLAEGVFAVIEVKSNLNRKKLIEAGSNLMKVSSLDTNVRTLITSNIAIDRPLRLVFAYESAKFDTLIDEIYKQNWLDLFDLICVLNRGILIKKDGLFDFQNGGDFVEIDGSVASLAFLYYCLTSYSSKFLGRSLNIDSYFEPFSSWGSVGSWHH